MSPIDDVKKIILALEEFIPLFDQTVYDPDRKSHLLDWSRKLADRYKDAIKIDMNDNSIDNLFKYASYLADIKESMNEIMYIISFNMLEISELKMSDTFTRSPQLHMNTIVRLIKKVMESISWNIIIDKIGEPQWDLIVTAKNKYPKTIELFVELVNKYDTDPTIDIHVERAKQAIFVDNTKPDKLSSNYYLNMIQRYGMSGGQYIPLEELVKKEFNIIGKGKELFASISKLTGKNVVTIMRNTNVIYFTNRLFKNPINVKAGIGPQMIKGTRTISRHTTDLKSEMTLYQNGKSTNLLNRRKSGMVIDDIGPTIVLESIDGLTWRCMSIDKLHLSHLITGPNIVVAKWNNYIEKSIIGAHIGPKEVKYISTHIPSHIRQRILAQTMDLYNKKTMNMGQLDAFITSDDIIHIYEDNMLNVFNDHVTKNKQLIIRQESQLSFLGDLNTRSRRYKKELAAEYGKHRKSFIPLQPHEKYGKLETIIKNTLAFIITEKDNIFNIIDEKETLLSK